MIEREIDLSDQGIGSLLDFLSCSFGGGTDLTAMNAVLEKLAERAWNKADVLLVSDGEWGAPDSVRLGVERARDRGTRFHGVQVGNRGRTGLHALCDPVHVFRDWLAMDRPADTKEW